MTDPRGDYVEQVRRGAGSLSPELAAAFASVPREAFVPDGFQRRAGGRAGGWVRPADADFLATVYSDDVLITKVDGRVPISSSSQPSLMAIMIETLRVSPGLRILEVGAGTGYNAALLAALGATIISIDVQEDVADRARSALARAGIAAVRVEHADGYAGYPGELFDRVIVTVGVGGVSPHWLDQLGPGGFVVAPVEHAGSHPVLEVAGPPGGPVTAVPVCAAGFMTAAGPLTADRPGAFPHPVPADAMPALTAFAGPRFDPPLDPFAYRNLAYAAGAWNRHATGAAVPGHDQPCVALAGDAGTVAAIPPDGSVLAGGERAADFAAVAAEVLDRWTSAGRPTLRAWRVGLSLTGDPHAPIWAPSNWELVR